MHDDCYFYLYSECKLKERCRYRHNLLSKDNLILCTVWSKNKKCRLDCPLRHSLYHVVKQRSDTMCYWEDKGGCTKYRCEYKHLDSKKDEWKEPKIKLLTEIIENKNMLSDTMETISVNKLVGDDTVDMTQSDAYLVENTSNLNETIAQETNTMEETNTQSVLSFNPSNTSDTKKLNLQETEIKKGESANFVSVTKANVEKRESDLIFDGHTKITIPDTTKNAEDILQSDDDTNTKRKIKSTVLKAKKQKVELAEISLDDLDQEIEELNKLLGDA